MEESSCGTRVLLLLPHDLLSSSCKSDSDRPIAHSDLLFLSSSSQFFVVRSLVLLQVCSSSSNRWFFFSSAVLQVPKSSLRDSVLLFRTRVLKTRDLCGIFCPTHLAQRLTKRVFET